MFGDRVVRAVMARESQLVLGLDPDPSRLWPAAMAAESGGGSAGRSGRVQRPHERAARAVLEHCRVVIGAVAEQCVGVKFQLACFERLGGPGWEALRASMEHAREHELLIIADAKRGDIGMTARAYAHAFFGREETDFGVLDGLGADALTVNPLLGSESLEPLLDAARAQGAGLFVLVRTSNPGATEFQELELATGGTVCGRLARAVAGLGAGGLGRCGLSDVGAVVGATLPERVAELRELMPETIFLLPGVGPQGGEVERLRAAFAPGPAGGLVPVSRAIADAHQTAGADPADAARRAAVGLREAIWALAA